MGILLASTCSIVPSPNNILEAPVFTQQKQPSQKQALYYSSFHNNHYCSIR